MRKRTALNLMMEKSGNGLWQEASPFITMGKGAELNHYNDAMISISVIEQSEEIPQIRPH